MEGDGEDCDREISNIVCSAECEEEDDDDDDDVADEVEPEIETAAQLTAEDLAKPPSEIMCRLKITQDGCNLRTKQHKKISTASCPGGIGKTGKSGSSGESGSSESGSETHKSLGGSPLAIPRNPSRCGGDQFRLRLGEFSGRSSRKGSSCSTPVSGCRNEVDYPSQNFIRNSLSGISGFGKGISLDDNSRLTIRLHYNPVMDEWISLTEDSAGPRIQDADILFDLHKREVDDKNEDEDEEVISVAYFLESLEKSGIRRSDPRLKEMIKNLDEIRRESKVGGIGALSFDYLHLERNTFKAAIDPCINLLSRAFKCQFVLPEFGHVCKEIKNIYQHCKENTNGDVASYIPQLARYSPEYWGVSICTVDGQRFSIGDVDIPFTMQSCSKPFTYGVCLNELGAQTVHQYVGQEPSGRMFNELSLDYNNKPHNPLLNSGAIMSASLLLDMVYPDMKMSEKFDFVENYLQRIAGGEFFSFNNSIFLSEKDTADRNFALAYYMKENKSFPKGFVLQDCLDFYFQTCSMEVNCETLAVMGATLANGGECPITGEATLSPGTVRDVLSLMHRDLFWTDPYFRAAWGDDDFEELRRKRLRDHQLLLDKFGKEIGQPTRCDNCIKGGEAEPKIEEPSDKPKDGEDKNELDEDTKEMDIAIKEDDLWPLFLPLSFFMGPALGLPQDSASQLLRVVEDDTKFEVSLDTHEYRPDELKINIDNNILTIEGKHEEKSDDGDSHVAKHFFKRYTLPAGCQAETVNSNLSSDGVLMIKAPKNPELLHNERAVPIELKKEDVAIKLKKEDAAIELKKEDGAEVVVKKND